MKTISYKIINPPILQIKESSLNKDQREVVIKYWGEVFTESSKGKVIPLNIDSCFPDSAILNDLKRTGLIGTK